MQRRVFVSRAAGAAGAAMVVGPGSARAQQTVWEEVGSPDGRYRLKIPKGYRYLQVPAHGGVLHSYVIMLPDKFTLELLDVAFTSPQPNIPTTAAGLQFALDQTQGGMQKSWPDSTVLEQRPVTAGAVAGREVALATDRGSRVVIARLYLTPVAIYMQIAQGPAAERRNPVIAQFMDSLRLG